MPNQPKALSDYDLTEKVRSALQMMKDCMTELEARNRMTNSRMFVAEKAPRLAPIDQMKNLQKVRGRLHAKLGAATTPAQQNKIMRHIQICDDDLNEVQKGIEGERAAKAPPEIHRCQRYGCDRAKSGRSPLCDRHQRGHDS